MKKLGLGLLVLLYLGSINMVKAQPIIKINPIDKRCVNGSIISLNNFVTVNGNPTTKGIWSSPSNGIIYGDKFSPVVAGVSSHPGWKVIYEYIDSVTSISYKDSSYVTIFALPKPFAGVDDSICTGAMKPLAGIPLIPPGTWRGMGVEGSLLNWSFNPDTTGIINGGSYSTIYHYTDYNQCENEDTMMITVFRTPIVEAGNPKDFCTDAMVKVLTGNPAGGIWTGKGVAGNQFYPSLATTGVHVLTYKYTNVICTASDSVNYSVWDLPVVTAATQSGKTYFCRNDGWVQLNGQPSGSGGIWSGPGITGTNFNTAIGADTISNYSLRYQYTDSHQCYNKADFIIKVRPEPVVLIDPSGKMLCFGKPYTIRAQYIHADGVFWWKGTQADGNIIGNPDSTSISYNPGLNDQSRLYFWLYVKTTHADSICEPAYDSMQIEMSAMPAPDFTANPLTGSAPLSVQFNDLSTINPGKISTWIWSFGDGDMSGDQNPLHIYLLPARYDVTLKVISDAGCEKEIKKPNYIANSIELNNHNPQFLLYPNPAHNRLIIENPVYEPVTLMISDIYGKNQIQQNVLPGKSTLNISTLKPGIYILRLNDSFVYRLVVE